MWHPSRSVVYPQPGGLLWLSFPPCPFLLLLLATLRFITALRLTLSYSLLRTVLTSIIMYRTHMPGEGGVSFPRPPREKFLVLYHCMFPYG